MHYHLTTQSNNVKTGPIPVSTSSQRTCPPSCPFKGNGCYAGQAPLVFHWSKVTSGQRGTPFASFLRSIESLPPNQLWRHNQAGDLPGIGNRIDRDKLVSLASANKNKRGFTYTHKPCIATAGVPSSVSRANLTSVRQASRLGFTINLSGNSLAHADRLAKTGLPVATVVPSDSPSRFTTPAGNRVVICPAQRSDTITCSTCGLCAKSNRGIIIGFLPHGNGAKRVNSVCTTNTNTR
jgi:hypothetical protein